MQAQALGLKRQRFDVSGERVVRLVAMHVHQLALLGCQLAQQFHAQGALFISALEVRNAAHHVHTHGQRALEFVHALRVAQHAILREGDQLQVQIRRHAAFDFQQGLDGQQAWVANVHVGADRQQAFGHGPVAVRHGAINQRIQLEQRL